VKDKCLEDADWEGRPVLAVETVNHGGIHREVKEQEETDDYNNDYYYYDNYDD
jgi:hypothetical protein